MRYLSFLKMIFLVTFLLLTSVAANDIQSVRQPGAPVEIESAGRSGSDTSDAIKVEDSSGSSSDEIRKIAEEVDKEANLRSTSKATQEKDRYERFVPPTDKYDWIELTSGEWLKGEFKGMYRKQLEFDSDKLKLMTFDFEDVRQIRTHRIVTVNIFAPSAEGEGLFGFRNRTLEMTGVLRLNETKMILVQGNGVLEFERDLIISIAYGFERVGDNLSGKVNMGINLSTGNSETLDYTTMALIMYRTSQERVQVDYLGNILTANNEETTNNHRINETYDIFLTDKVFYSPLFSEYYRDKYQNIRNRYTVGFGAGYMLIDSAKVEWEVSGGPAYLYTEFNTVEAGGDDSSQSAALALSTSYSLEVTQRIDYIFDYAMTWSNKRTGSYKHHMVTTLENELTGSLDIDMTLIWDYTQDPEPNEDNSIPDQSDLRLLFSLGVDF